MEAVEIALREALDCLVSAFLQLPVARGFHLTVCATALRDAEERASIMISPEEGHELEFCLTLRTLIDKLETLKASPSCEEAVRVMRSMNIRRAFYEEHIRGHGLNGQFVELEEPLRKVSHSRNELYQHYHSLTSQFPKIDPNVVLEACWRASFRYDPSAGYRFPTYAQHWIRAFAQRAALANAKESIGSKAETIS